MVMSEREGGGSRIEFERENCRSVLFFFLVFSFFGNERSVARKTVYCGETKTLSIIIDNGCGGLLYCGTDD